MKLKPSKPITKSKPKTLSLFTGAGGLDLGLERAGYRIVGCVEVDDDARHTIALNRPEWQLSSVGDVHGTSPVELLKEFNIYPGELDLLSGGPPCQPFSSARYWVNGAAPLLLDPRSRTIHAYLDIMEFALPKYIILENVPGIRHLGELNRGKPMSALDLIEKRLRVINKKAGTNYNFNVIDIDCADYGVPQHRKRVFIISSRDGKEIKLPLPTHGPGREKEYATAWDSIGDLDFDVYDPELKLSGKWADLLKSIPEGENYLWHTNRKGGIPLFGWRTKYWSFLLKLAKNQPSWTIQAKPGPAIGPFHWGNRRLSIRELCRLQTFPENYQIFGAYRSQVIQVGNAVPSAIGELLGQVILNDFITADLTLAPVKRLGCPSPTKPVRVPAKYLTLKGDHPDHPGKGLGPSAIKRSESE